MLRHGPRTPVDTYPNDPYVNSGFEPTGWGHITNVSGFKNFEKHKSRQQTSSNSQITERQTGTV